ESCRDDERHYHVKVYRYNQITSRFCGGSLTMRKSFSEKSPITVHLGVHPKSAPKWTDTVTQLEVYRDSNGRYHDIMLLKLSRKTEIRPDYLTFQIRFSSCNLFSVLFFLCFRGTKVQIAGYGPAQVGLLNKRSEMNVHLPEVVQYIVSILPENHRCVFNDRLYGITGDAWYALSAPSAFIDVCAYKQWIDDTIN
uniref:Peptidase S1 domain-containing protein n=1 Tax=Poecilia mexicana TaxID=48701 RepID=A0A3B3XA85_9TELE